MINKDINNKIKVDLSADWVEHRYTGNKMFLYITNSFIERTLENISRAYTKFAFWNGSYVLGFDIAIKRIKS